MTIRKILVVAGLLFVLGAGDALAQERLAGQWWYIPEVAAQMKLTKQEQEKLDELYLANRRNLIDQRARMEKERLALEESLEAEPLNEAKIVEQFKRVEMMRSNLADMRFRYYLILRTILGAERYKQFLQSRQNYRHVDRSASKSQWWNLFRR